MRFALEKSLVYIIIAAVLITFIFIFYLIFSQGTRSIEISLPNGGEEWGIGYTHKITWRAKGIDKVGIVLFKGTEPKWIAQNLPANLKKYEWKIYPGQEYGDDYWIAVFEYPWKEDNKIDFSDGAFAIVYPKLASCERLSVNNEWPHVPSDMPLLRRVFITKQNYKGNLGGLDGADRICQREAEEQDFGGTWQAFLGGESDDDLAVKRLEKTPGGIEGIFIEAEPEATLIRGAACHRLLGKDFNNFLEIFSNSIIVNREKLDSEFYKDIQNVWLGRMDGDSKKSCIEIDIAGITISEKHSLTVTCQNWSTGNKLIEGSGSSLPTCYTSEGTVTQAVALSGLISGIVANNFTPYQGKYCDNSQKLLCIEE